jgi:hypothetical protein
VGIPFGRPPPLCDFKKYGDVLVTSRGGGGVDIVYCVVFHYCEEFDTSVFKLIQYTFTMKECYDMAVSIQILIFLAVIFFCSRFKYDYK